MLFNIFTLTYAHSFMYYITNFSYPKIFTTCRAVLCRQLRILKLLQFVQSRSEWHELDEKVASVVGTLAAPEDSHLMSAR